MDHDTCAGGVHSVKSEKMARPGHSNSPCLSPSILWWLSFLIRLVGSVS